MAFLIVLLVIFSLTVIPYLNLFYILFSVPAIGFSIANVVMNKKDEYKTKKLDIAILVLSVVAIIPFVGYVAKAVALAFCIVNLNKITKK